MGESELTLRGVETKAIGTQRQQVVSVRSKATPYVLGISGEAVHLS